MSKDLNEYLKVPLILNNHKDVDIYDIFETLKIDSDLQFVIKDEYKNLELWYTNSNLRKLYYHHSLFFEDIFNKEGIPQRCKSIFDILYDKFIKYLKKGRNRISIKKARYTLEVFFKNISRIKYHNTYVLKYQVHSTGWLGCSKRLSRDYFLELINLLEQEEHLISYKGFQLKEDTDQRNITSMILINPNFIDQCNSEKPLIMEEEFTVNKVDSLTIRGINKKDKELTSQEKKESEVTKELMDSYNNKLKIHNISINGFKLYELFFRCIYALNLQCGGRIYQKGDSIQSVSSRVRSTICIDDDPTVEKDYKYLHIAMAYEEKGIKIERDPYDFGINIPLDERVIREWCIDNGIKRSTYNPIRNFKKMILLTMLNAKDSKDAVLGARYNIIKDYSKRDKGSRRFVGILDAPVTEAIMSAVNYHDKISNYFMSGAGVRFQNLDSKMIIYCISKFIEKNEIIIPVHDSIIVKEKYSSVAVETMEEAYNYVMGSKLNCKIV